jgi:serine/alanine adding enzyme
MTEIFLNDNRGDLWDSYISIHPQASVYHRYSFKSVVESTYGQRAYYFSAKEGIRIIGVLPLFHIKSIFLGNSLVSLPFCDYGGILADNTGISTALFQKAFELSQKLKCQYIELRQTSELSIFTDDMSMHACINKEKARMKLHLPESAEDLFANFPAKLRSQIRKPQKEGCIARIGGKELIEDFYTVFAHNMRDLGSPVHSKKLMLNMLNFYGDECRIFVVYYSGEPVACSLVAGFRDTLDNPWASFKRTSRKIAPNMLLYWEMLKYAIASGYRFFDFGRSTFDEGTYRFKSQWGARPEQLFWYRAGSDIRSKTYDYKSENQETFVRFWRALPLPLTKMIGPILRKHLHI